MEELQISFGNYQTSLTLERELGKGAFGTVHLARDDRGYLFAVKRSECINNETYTTANQEIAILLNLKHENIAKMYAFDFQNTMAIIIMEYCAGGDLNSRLEREVTYERKMEWIVQLLDAMTYLHDNNIAHRDLKPENVLLSKDMNIKVTDFGISRYYYVKKDLFASNLSEYRQAFMGTFAGTPYWIAPEVFDERYTLKADLFSLGVIFHAILHQKFIEHDGKKYFGVFVKHNGKDVGLGLVMFEQNVQLLPEQKFEKNEKVDAMVRSLLHKNPDERISLAKATELMNEQSIEIREEEEKKKQVQISLVATICNFISSWIFWKFWRS